MSPKDREPRDPQEPLAQVVFSLSEDETREIGRRLGVQLLGGEMIALVGELGSGKTVFVRGLAEGLGIDPDEISSPTFVLAVPHEGRVPLFHVDLYRIERAEEIHDLGIEEFLESGGVVAVEWGDRLPEELRNGALEVRLADLGEDSRRIAFATPGG